MARHRERHLRHTMSTAQIETAQGIAHLTKRGPDWWEVVVATQFLGVIVRWNTDVAPWEVLLPLGSNERGITMRPRFASLEEAVFTLAALFGRRWQSWPQQQQPAGIES